MFDWNHIVKMTIIFSVFLFLMLAMQSSLNHWTPEKMYFDAPNQSFETDKIA